MPHPTTSFSSLSDGVELTEVQALRQELLRREHENDVERTRLQSHLLRVRGRVHVKVRIRPRNTEEQNQGYAMASEAVGVTELAFMDPRAGRWRPFAFDAVHSPTATQTEGSLVVRIGVYLQDAPSHQGVP